jgi:hypothetical protein
MRFPALALALTACLATSALLPTRAHALYRVENSNAMWPRGTLIRVCWKPGIDPEGALQKRIRATVEDWWGRYSSIGFTGWDTCPASTPAGMVGQHGIFIEPSSGATSSYQGRQFTGMIPSQPIPTLMSINFDAPVRSLCDIFAGGNSNDDCVTWSAAHEFGHALGFKHEHARPDFEECTRSIADVFDGFFRDKREGGGVALTTYDSGSIMNYCASTKGALSNKDVAGLQSVYGLKPRGSMVGPGGRCLDVDNRNLGDGSVVQLWDCLDGTNQRWAWEFPDGLFKTHALNDACLDDGSGGTQPGSGVDVWHCPGRANPRWNFDQFYLQGFGNKCIDVDLQGRVVYTGCRFGASFQWTYTALGQIQRFLTSSCLVFGALGTQPTHAATCDPNRLDQQIDLTASGFLVTRSHGLCLEVPDNPPYSMSNLPIVMANCDSGKLSQKFYFSGFMKTAAGLFMSHAPADVSRNGVRVTVEQSSTRTVFWDFHTYGF